MNRRVRKATAAQETHIKPENPHVWTASKPPDDWVIGQLLNVRSYPDGYRITLLAEDFDPQHPERCLYFPNGAEAQNFVSRWYARMDINPREEK